MLNLYNELYTFSRVLRGNLVEEVSQENGVIQDIRYALLWLIVYSKSAWTNLNCELHYAPWEGAPSYN